MIKYEFQKLAEKQLMLALEVKEKLLPKNSVDFCDIYDNLASIWLQSNQQSKAKEYFEKSLEIRIIKFGGASIKIVPNLTNLSVALFALQEDEMAKDKLETALSILQQTQVNGEIVTSSIYAAVLDNLAKYYYKSKQFKNSVNLFEDSLAVKEKCVGVKHTHYAIGLDQLGVAMTTYGINENNIELIEKSFSLLLLSLELFESILGKDTTSYAITLNNIGYHASVTNNWNDAIKYLSESSHILTGRNNNLATIANSNLDAAQNKSKDLILPLFHDNFSLPTQQGNIEIWTIPDDWREILELAGYSGADLQSPELVQSIFEAVSSTLERTTIGTESTTILEDNSKNVYTYEGGGYEANDAYRDYDAYRDTSATAPVAMKPLKPVKPITPRATSDIDEIVYFNVDPPDTTTFNTVNNNPAPVPAINDIGYLNADLPASSSTATHDEESPSPPIPNNTNNNSISDRIKLFEQLSEKSANIEKELAWQDAKLPLNQVN